MGDAVLSPQKGGETYARERNFRSPLDPSQHSAMAQIPGQPLDGQVMFAGERHATRDAAFALNLRLQQLLWQLIEQIPAEQRGYLQLFELTARFDMKLGILQHIVHRQERPPMLKEVDIPLHRPVCGTFLAIDDGNGCATLLLAEEY